MAHANARLCSRRLSRHATASASSRRSNGTRDPVCRARRRWTLRAESAQIPLPSGRQQRAEELLRALLSLYLDKSSPHVLGPGADIRSVFLVDPGVAVIDLNSAFADTHRSGVLVEELTVASLIHTITANTPDILKVKILVDGKERDTLAGHADLSSFYDVTAVNQLATQLQ